jgi:type IV secretory pathway protease TraF
VAGDTVVAGPFGISVNGRRIPNSAPLGRDEGGRPLTAYPFGTYTVPVGQAWLVSSYNDHSYDSRYFGPIATGTIERKERPVWTFR